MLIDGNYEYKIHHKNVDGTISYWRCAKKWCKAKLRTGTESEENNILKRLGEHNHSATSVSVKIKSMMSGSKTTSLSSND